MRTDDINKISENNIVDISFKNSDDEYKKGTSKNEENGKEISFTKSEQTNTQATGWNTEKEKKDINNEWDNIKGEYNELSQNKMDYKKYDNEIVSKKYADVDDDAKSVSSVSSALSNFTDISQVKKIHISETKNRKPSFF